MQLIDIEEAMHAYQNMLNSAEQLVSFYDAGTYFDYQEIPLGSSEYIHAYPGLLYGTTPVFFLIASEYDQPGVTDITDYIVACPLTGPHGNGSNPIPNKEAQARIDRWCENYRQWIPAEVKDYEFGMFQAFNVPAGDVTEPAAARFSLALEMDADVPTRMAADMIVTNTGKTVENDDLVKPIPPYGPSAAAASFYLLSLAQV